MTRFSTTVLRNSTISFTAQVVIKLLSFAFSILIVRRLGAEQYGQYVAVLAFGAIFVFVADLGLSPYTVRAIARLREETNSASHIAQLYGNILWLRLLLALLAAMLIIGAAWITKRPPEMIRAIALGTLGLLMYGVQGGAEAVLMGFERLDVAAGGRVVQQIIFVTLGGIVLWIGAGYIGLILANLVGIAILSAICWRGVRRLGIQQALPQPIRWLTLIRAGLPFGIISLTLGLSYKFDTILLNIYRGDIQTGYYNAAYTLVFAAVMLSNTVNTALYPSLARQTLVAPGSLPAIYQRTLRYLMAVSLPIACGGWIIADGLIPFLFGPEYIPSISVLQIVIWVIPFMYLSEFLGYVVVVAGQEKTVARAVLISTGANILANTLLIPRYGIIAAAFTTVATEIVLVTQYLWFLRTQLPVRLWGQAVLGPLSASLAMSGVAALLHGNTPLLINVFVAALSYAVFLTLFRVVGVYELQHLRSFWSPAAR